MCTYNLTWCGKVLWKALQIFGMFCVALWIFAHIWMIAFASPIWIMAMIIERVIYKEVSLPKLYNLIIDISIGRGVKPWQWGWELIDPYQLNVWIMGLGSALGYLILANHLAG